MFRNGEKERVLRGVIAKQDEWSITLARRDGEVQIAKSSIIKIDKRKGVSDEECDRR